jgi:hypothetical protein
MNRQSNKSLGLVVFFLLVGMRTASFAAEEKFDAIITFCGGQTTSVRDLRVVYAWREMPANVEGLVPCKERSRTEQGVWVVGGNSSQPALQLVPFEELDSIEFESDVQQLGLSLVHQFRVSQVWFKKLDGRRVSHSDELLAPDKPILWPSHARLSFPDDAANKRLDRIIVSLQALTKIEGQDSPYVFAFPTDSATGIQSVLKKQRDAFPRLIRFVRSGPADQTRAQR